MKKYAVIQMSLGLGSILVGILFFLLEKPLGPVWPPIAHRAVSAAFIVLGLMLFLIWIPFKGWYKKHEFHLEVAVWGVTFVLMGIGGLVASILLVFNLRFEALPGLFFLILLTLTSLIYCPRNIKLCFADECKKRRNLINSQAAAAYDRISTGGEPALPENLRCPSRGVYEMGKCSKHSS